MRVRRRMLRTLTGGAILTGSRTRTSRRSSCSTWHATGASHIGRAMLPLATYSIVGLASQEGTCFA